MFLLPSCGTIHCTDDNNVYTYIDPSDLLKQPYQGNPVIHFYGNSGHELIFNSQNEQKEYNKVDGGGDPDCPIIYYDERIIRNLELENQTPEKYSSWWSITYLKDRSYLKSNKYRIALLLKGKYYFDTQFYEDMAYRDSVFIAGEWLKAHQFKDKNNSFTWTAKYGISTFTVDSEEFVLIP
ncbi:MAG: hypothetical protein CFE21_16035 [Bacteroidetes bacterium B1(2017)]|nr:MAG: hypothetical protein CFE21_16035 [Bacteroidetes bacterium B1(2017)]